MKSLIFFVFASLTIVGPSVSNYVSPNTFLDSRLSKGTWLAKKDIISGHNLFEGGWIWSESGKLEVTHICRARTGTSRSFRDVKIEPGELFNGTCYISGYPNLDSPSYIMIRDDYEVL